MANRLGPISPAEIGFDIDGVVADTMGTFIRIAREDFGIDHITRDQITTYWLEDCLSLPEETVAAIVDRILEDPLGVGLQPLPGAREALETLAEQQGVLTFVTARPTRRPIEAWLEALLPGAQGPGLRVIATGLHAAKAGVLEELGLRYFLEDHLETCQSLWSRGIHAIVYDQPWNQGDTPFRRVKSWEELLAMVGHP